MFFNFLDLAFDPWRRRFSLGLGLCVLGGIFRKVVTLKKEPTKEYEITKRMRVMR